MWRYLVVDVQQNYPRWCIGLGIGIGIGRGKSLACITAVQSTTSPIVKTLGKNAFLHTNVDFLHTNLDFPHTNVDSLHTYKVPSSIRMWIRCLVHDVTYCYNLGKKCVPPY